MAKIYSRKKVIFAKLETTYGTPATAAGSDAIQTSQLQISPLEGDAISLDLDKPGFGADLATLVGKHVVVTFRVPLAGGGTPAGTAPKWGTIMKACGHSETVVATTSVTYAPIDDDPIPSVTLRFERGTTLHSITGSRGSVKVVTDKRNYPWFEFSFMGLYNPPVTNASPLAPVFTAWKKPVPFRASTVSCSLIGQTIGLHSMNVDFGQKVEFYEHSEEESVVITDRNASFQCEFEETPIATHDFFNDINSETTGALSYVHGVVAGNIVTINSPLTQITAVKLGDQQGVSSFQGSGPLVSDGTNPDYSIVCT